MKFEEMDIRPPLPVQSISAIWDSQTVPEKRAAVRFDLEFHYVPHNFQRQNGKDSRRDPAPYILKILYCIFQLTALEKSQFTAVLRDYGLELRFPFFLIMGKPRLGFLRKNFPSVVKTAVS